MTKPVRSSDLLAAIGERLRTQDNRCTQNPMFCVQVKRKDYGYDPGCADGCVWVDMENGIELEEYEEGAQEVGFKERWETVMVAFTEEGCKEHLELNSHNYNGEVRIYVESFNRCPEMIAIREHLMAANAKLTGVSPATSRAACCSASAEGGKE